MDSDKHRIHTNYMSTDAENVNNEVTMRNTMKSQSITGTGLVSSAMGSGTFQFFVECDEGINLYVDLDSSPSDWMRRCSYELGLPQNLHKRKFKSRPSVEMGANVPPATAQGAFLRNGFDEFYGSQESFYNNCSKSCPPVLPQPSRAMEELSVQTGASGNGALCEKKQLGKEGIDQSSLTCMPVRESEPRNVEMGNQAAPGICQQGPEIELEQRYFSLFNGNSSPCFVRVLHKQRTGEIHRAKVSLVNFGGLEVGAVFSMAVLLQLAVQNQGRGIKRSLGVHYSHEIRNEMQCTHQPIQNSQDESQRYISKYNDDYKYKKSPNVKNLRFLKTLARGPLVQASAVKRRRSTRLVDKSP